MNQDQIDNKNLSSYSSYVGFQPQMVDIISFDRHSSQQNQEKLHTSRTSTTKSFQENFTKLDREARIGMLNYRVALRFSRNVKEE